MKNRLTLVFGFLGLVMGLAGSQAWADLTPSADRATIEALVNRAKAENKTVVLEVGAAWCGPCTQFAFEMDRHPENFKTLADQGYIFAKAESEKVVEGTPLNVTDFLPVTVRFFPTFYSYTPALGWQFIGTASTFAELSTNLKAVSGHAMLTIPEIRAGIEALAASGTDLGSITPENALLQASLNNVSESYGYEDMKAILALLAEEGAKYPNLQLNDVVDAIQMIFLVDYFGMGAVSFETLQADFPAATKDLIDLSSDSFSNHLFGQQLTYLYRKSGLEATSQQCSAIWQATRAKFVKGSLSDEDFQKKLADRDLAATILCADLEERVTGATDSLKQRVAALDQTKIGNWRLIAALGQTDEAVAIYNKQFSAYAANYNAGLKSLQTKLDKAIADGNQKLADQIKAKIEIVKFQLENHTQVDVDVETALRAGQPVQALKVLN